AGEYNENYLVNAADGKYVLRINHDSQLGLGNGQIQYEYTVLKALEDSGVTPRVHRVQPAALGLGPVLLMDYIPGGPFLYDAHLEIAARIFARVHSQPVSPELLVQSEPVFDIAQESYGLFMRFPDHPLNAVRERLQRYYDEIMDLHLATEDEFASESMVIVNTEVNSGNFIVDGMDGWLVDWEKAVVSHRYQDLGHFLVPTTTLWKSEHRISPTDRLRFLEVYREESGLDTDLDTLSRRTEILERTILLRALSWCFMAYYEYTRPGRELRDEKTFERIRWYLDEIECFLA
ncbi:MAG: phosphotransferase, partial [Proteobacteria bacterium]|nr:phosphotransferase [Pseudomonadota bacterium]